MRLDLFLKTSRLIVRRSLAQEFCDAGLISVNGYEAKSSKDIKPGDEIEIKRPNRLVKIKVIDVPARKQLSKQDAGNLFEIISEEERAADLFE